MEKVSDFKFLGTYISQDLTWSANTNALVKKSTTETVQIEVTEESQLVTGIAAVLLQMLHGEYYHLQHPGVV